MLTRPVVLYDGACGFCRRMVALLERLDRSEVFAAIPAAARHTVAGLPSFADAALAGAMHLVLPDGRVFAAGAAVREIVRRLPGGAPLAALMGLPVVRSLVEWVYRLIAANRHRIGCGSDVCAAQRS